MVVRIVWRSFVRGLFEALDPDNPYSAKEYGPNWTKQRQECLERDDWTCRACGVAGDELNRELSVHHITDTPATVLWSERCRLFVTSIEYISLRTKAHPR